MAGRHCGKARGKAVLVHAVLYFYKGRCVACEMKAAPVKPVYDVHVQVPQCKQKIAVARKKRLRPVRYRKAGAAAGRRHGIHAEQHGLQGLRRTALPLSKAVYLLQNGGEKLPVYGNTLLCELQARLRDGKRYVLQN